MERLESLIKDRQEWITISEKNNFDFDMILLGLYNDPSHFIYEILQNAEDVEASTVEFLLGNYKRFCTNFVIF